MVMCPEKIESMYRVNPAGVGWCSNFHTIKRLDSSLRIKAKIKSIK